MKETLILYKDWWEVIRTLPADMQLEAYNSICAYAFEGEEPKNAMVAAVTALMRSAIDRDTAKWQDVREKRRAAIKARWDKHKAEEAQAVQSNTTDTKDTSITTDTNEYKCIQVEEVNTSATVNVNDNVNVNVNVNGNKEKIKKESVCVSSELEQLFEEFRKAYPGRKRGHETEFEAFKRKYKNWQEIVPLLMPALQRLMQYNEEAAAQGKWTASIANLSTWLFQARWEEELPELTKATNDSTAPKASAPTDDDYDEDCDAFKSID